jgi:hypothetical protein
MDRSLPVLAALAALTVPGSSEGLHLGVKGGVPATAYFETGRQGPREYSAATRRYVVGVSTEWRPNRRLGIELDVLYRRMGYVAILPASALDTKGHSWDFPVLAKYRLGRDIRPYLAGGGVLRYIGPVRARGQAAGGEPIDTTQPPELRKRHYPGVAAAGGVEFQSGRVRLLPEFRYTRWTANRAGPGSLLRFSPGQSEFLLGLLF